MRKIQFFSLALFAMLFVACGSDTIEGNTEYLASNALITDVNGTAMEMVLSASVTTRATRCTRIVTINMC